MMSGWRAFGRECAARAPNRKSISPPRTGHDGFLVAEALRDMTYALIRAPRNTRANTTIAQRTTATKESFEYSAPMLASTAVVTRIATVTGSLGSPNPFFHLQDTSFLGLILGRLVVRTSK